jgi:hypothetical protein
MLTLQLKQDWLHKHITFYLYAPHIYTGFPKNVPSMEITLLLLISGYCTSGNLN